MDKFPKGLLIIVSGIVIVCLAGITVALAGIVSDAYVQKMKLAYENQKEKTEEDDAVQEENSEEQK
ncbi:MAG: hypothetical protein FWD01_01110 [Defluviitaleaceae bacterium]|nr:hypothetical protein [Defluviitaleaceae bacterium]